MARPEDKATPNEHTIMFGSIVPNIFNSIHSSLHALVQEKVSTLPIIQHEDEESCEIKLYAKLSNVYTLHLDMAQLYAEKELFVINKKYSRKKREKIVNEFLALHQGSSEPGSIKYNQRDTKSDTMTDDIKGNFAGTKDGNSNEKEVILRYTIPNSSEQIPSSDQITSIDNEITFLHKQLRKINERKYALKQQQKALKRSGITVNEANEALSKVVGKDGDVSILESVREIEGSKGRLQELNVQAQGLMHKMKAMDANKPNSNETKEFGDAMKVAVLEASREVSRPRKKQTLEEDYQDRLKGTTEGVMKFFQKI